MRWCPQRMRQAAPSLTHPPGPALLSETGTRPREQKDEQHWSSVADWLLSGHPVLGLQPLGYSAPMVYHVAGRESGGPGGPSAAIGAFQNPHLPVRSNTAVPLDPRL